MLPIDCSCPTCGDKSSVMLTNPTAWLMGYSIIVKDGKLHDHNPNKQFVEFKCSKGHKWLLEYFKPCPTCYLTAGVGGQNRAIK